MLNNCRFAAEFPAHFDAETNVARDGDDIIVRWSQDGEKGEERFDYLLAATGRRPNLDRIGLENTSVALNDRGVPDVDPMSMLAM